MSGLSILLNYGEHILLLLGGLRAVVVLGNRLAGRRASGSLPTRQGPLLPAEGAPQAQGRGRRGWSDQEHLEALYPPPGRSMEVNDYEITIRGRTTTLR